MKSTTLDGGARSARNRAAVVLWAAFVAAVAVPIVRGVTPECTYAADGGTLTGCSGRDFDGDVVLSAAVHAVAPDALSGFHITGKSGVKY